MMSNKPTRKNRCYQGGERSWRPRWLFPRGRGGLGGWTWRKQMLGFQRGGGPGVSQLSPLRDALLRKGRKEIAAARRGVAPTESEANAIAMQRQPPPASVRPCRSEARLSPTRSNVRPAGRNRAGRPHPAAAAVQELFGHQRDLGVSQILDVHSQHRDLFPPWRRIV